MSCPPEIARVLLAILDTGLLHIRYGGGSGAADHCALEADHLHNLPQLLRSYAPELLHYYWEVEIPSFRSRAEALKLDVGHFESLWRQLHPLVEVSMRNDLALTK